MTPIKTSRHTNVVFLLFPKIHLLDLSGAAQVFYEANQLGGNTFQVIYAGASENVPCEQGPVFSSLVNVSSLELKKGDVLIIPGIDFLSFTRGEIDSYIAELQPWIIRQRKNGVLIGSICSGALILARWGLLDNTPCTTHWKCLAYARKTFPAARFLDNRLYVMDKDIFTSAGMTAGIDMALALVEKWRNPLLAARVAREMVINVRRAETRDQENIFLDFENHFNALVYKAQELLAGRLDTQFTLADLAATMNISERHLARLFKHHTGQTIAAYRDRLRIEHAENLLLNTEMFVKEIAVACGYESSRQFARVWHRHKKIPPGLYRHNHSLRGAEA